MRRRSLDSGRSADLEVVLVEELVGPSRGEGAAAGASPPHDGPPSAAAVDRRRRARATAARAVAVVAALLVLGGVGVLQSRQQAVVAQGWGGEPALLGPAHVPPAVLWRVTDGRVAGLGENHVLVATPDGLLHGIDPRSGAAVWSTSRLASDGSTWCTVLHRTPDGAGLTRTGAGGRAALAVCEHGWWVPTAPGDRARRTAATVVDPGTGAVLAERELAGGLLVSDVVDDDLLHAWADGTGRIGALRWDPWTGRVRWTFRSEDRITGWRSNGVSVHHGARTITFIGSGTLTVDLVTGTAVDRPRGDRSSRAPVDVAPQVRVVAEARGAVVRSDGVEAWASDVASGTELWRVPLAGVARLEPLTDGVVVALPVVDGSPHGALVGMHIRSGDALWRLPLPGGTTALRPGHGVVLLESREGVTALG